MKLKLALMMTVAVVSAVEDPDDQMVKICDNDLLHALQEACEKKSVEYLLKHGEYDPELELDQNHKHRDHHRRDHDHGHNHDHDHTYGHDHSLHHHDNRSHAKRGDDQDMSIVEKCCHRPCFVTEFVSYCG